jgi:hypothetical protein
LSIASIPTLCVSEPVLAPTTTIGRPMRSSAKRLDLVLAHVLDVEARRSWAVKSTCGGSAPYMTK